MKHPQFILALDKERFGELKHPLNAMHIDDFHRRAAGSLVISRREELEKDEKYGQILPYVVLWQRNPETKEISLFAYRRAKGSGESRLLGNHSVGVGGHVDLTDVYKDASSVIDLRITLAHAIRRELGEEILFKTKDGNVYTYDVFSVGNCVIPKFVGVINDTSNEVGRVHYGLLYMHEVPAGFEPYCREKSMETAGMIDVKSFDGATMENWSEIIIDQFSKIKEEL
jgi:predicted NUDIX family phosphoesterase